MASQGELRMPSHVDDFFERYLRRAAGPGAAEKPSTPAGAETHIHGDVDGDVVVEPGAALRINGEVGGDAIIDGALMIAGGVGGDFVVHPGGAFTNRGMSTG